MQTLWLICLPSCSKRGSWPKGVSGRKRSKWVWGVCQLTCLHLGPVLQVDAEIFEFQAAIFENEADAFGGAFAVEIRQFVSWGHVWKMKNEDFGKVS
jgi:hypothetical protein